MNLVNSSSKQLCWQFNFQVPQCPRWCEEHIRVPTWNRKRKTNSERDPFVPNTFFHSTGRISSQNTRGLCVAFERTPPKLWNFPPQNVIDVDLATRPEKQKNLLLANCVASKWKCVYLGVQPPFSGNAILQSIFFFKTIELDYTQKRLVCPANCFSAQTTIVTGLLSGRK